MKKLPKKGALLFASAMALYAFAMPSMSSASENWGVVGSHHVLDSINFGYFGHATGGILSTCLLS